MRLGRVLYRLAAVEREARRVGFGSPPAEDWGWFDPSFATTPELRVLRDAWEAGEEVTPEHPTMRTIRGRIERGERPPEERRPSPPSAGRGKRPGAGAGADGSAAEPAAEPEEPVRVEQAEPPEAAATAWKPSPEFAMPGYVWRAQGSREDGTAAFGAGIDRERIF